MELMQQIWDSFKDSWITYVLAAVGFVVGLAKFLDAIKKIGGHWSDFKVKWSGQKISDQNLKDESKETTTQLAVKEEISLQLSKDAKNKLGIKQLNAYYRTRCFPTKGAGRLLYGGWLSI